MSSIAVQGRLTGSTGTPLTNGVYPLCFRLCNSKADACTGDAKLFEEEQSVSVTNGIYTAHLDDTAPSHQGSLDNLKTTDPDNVYLEVIVGNQETENVCTNGTPLVPRVLLTHTPFAYRAKTADVAKSYAPSANLSAANLSAVDGTFTGNVGIGTTGSTGNLYVTGTISEGGTSLGSKYVPLAGGVNITGGLNIAGNVGIGTTNPSYKLDVNGNLNVNNTISFAGSGAYGTIYGDTSNGGRIIMGAANEVRFPGGHLKSGQSWPLQNRPVAGQIFS